MKYSNNAKFRVIPDSQPVSQILSTEQFLTNEREIKAIHVGQQFIVFINIFPLELLMIINRLSVLSDRVVWRQSRSEDVLPVAGIITLIIVSPAPSSFSFSYLYTELMMTSQLLNEEGCHA